MNNNALWIILHKLRIPLLVIIVTYSVAILGMVLIPGMDDNGNVYHLTFFDAFYFVSYMASTIGFGEAPYAFTYEQKLWVSFCIYITVIGWFYGLGALVSAVTDKTLKFEMMRSRFRKKVREIESDFVIVLGYTHVNAEIIRKLHTANMEVVLIDEDEEKINFFMLEELTQDVPVMVGDALLTETLQDAGILRNNCRGIVALFKNEEYNFRISILTKFLNSKVKVIAKSTHDDISKSILDTDIAKVINPFEVFAKRVDVALRSPHTLILENWIYGNSDLSEEPLYLPEGKYVICGYGRFGKALQTKFNKYGIEHVFIDAKRLANHKMIEEGSFIRANPDDKDILLDVGIKEAVALIVGTKNDIDNLSIVITAKKLNPNIYIIARENTMQEVSVFQAADIDWLFMIEQIYINKTSMALVNPIKYRFLKLVLIQKNDWTKSLINLLKNQVGSNPLLVRLDVEEESAYALYHELLNGVDIEIETLLRSLENREERNHALPLLLYRAGEEILLPSSINLKIGDQILFACTDKSLEEIELIASNIYELYYAKYGKEKENPLLRRFLK